MLGHVTDRWAAAGPAWGVHDFAVTNVGPDGHVPTSPEPAWLVQNVFRARPVVDDPFAPNLIAEIADACVGTCDGGPVEVSVVVSNVGGTPVGAGTPITLYTTTGDVRRVVATGTLPALPAGTRAQARPRPRHPRPRPSG